VAQWAVCASSPGSSLEASEGWSRRNATSSKVILGERISLHTGSEILGEGRLRKVGAGEMEVVRQGDSRTGSIVSSGDSTTLEWKSLLET
jgi:hypothetical protein